MAGMRILLALIVTTSLFGFNGFFIGADVIGRSSEALSNITATATRIITAVFPEHAVVQRFNFTPVALLL